MAQIKLEFLENRSWSSDHGSIIFSAIYEEKEVRFFVPRTTLQVLSPGAGRPSTIDYLELFDTHRNKIIGAAQLVFDHDRGFNSAYVITDLALQTNLCTPDPISPQLAA